MFKFLPLFLLGLVACSLSLPVEEKKNVEIINSTIEKGLEGDYEVKNESADGTKREETGTVVYDEEGKPSLEVRGFYTYINEFGEVVRVDYTAGKNGFVPVGSHISADITNTALAAKDLPKFEPEH